MKKSPVKLIAFTIILVVIAVSITISSLTGGKINPITNVVGAILVPVQRGANAVAQSVSGFFQSFYRYDSVVAENEVLKDRIAELETLERKFYSALDENEHLRQLSRLAVENPTYDYKLATVTAASIGSYSRVITLDLGTADGIELYDCVVVRGGLVGYVSKVGAKFSEVTTVTDVDINIGAVVSKPQELAVAEGTQEYMEQNLLKLSYLDTESKAEVGDAVETSGFGDIYPKGLLIGHIKEVALEGHGMAKYGVLEPAVDISQLKRVYVITSFGD